MTLDWIKHMQGWFWAAGIIFVAGTTYATMSADVARATEEYQKNKAAIQDMQKDFSRYRREQRRDYRQIIQGQHEMRILLEQLKHTRVPARP